MIRENFRTEEFYHHGIPIEYVNYGILKSDVSHTNDYEKLPCLWLESILGYYPTFVACGNDYKVFIASGYMNQFSRIKVFKIPKNVLRKKRESPNIVHFSFDELPNLTYMDFLVWFGPLNEIKSKRDFEIITKKWKKRLLKPSYIESRWKRKAKNEPGTVMAVVPYLDLRKAKTIYTRNKSTKVKLEEMGFENIKVERVKVTNFL